MGSGGLGPDTILWRYAGDRRFSFLGGSVGLLQLMHPAIGAGVLEHSDFFQDPMDRILRSLGPILGAVYDGPQAKATGGLVAGKHRTIHGTDPKGRSYDALDPETFWWAHATFQHMVEQIVDRFDKKELTPAEREQLYQEGLVWFRQYGVDDSGVPPTRAAFQVKFDQHCAEVLEMNPAAEFLLSTFDNPFQMPLPGRFAWLGFILRWFKAPKIISVPARASAISGLPAVLRERFDLPFPESDQELMRKIERNVRRTWRYLPDDLRWHERAKAGWEREGGAP